MKWILITMVFVYSGNALRCYAEQEGEAMPKSQVIIPEEENDAQISTVACLTNITSELNVIKNLLGQLQSDMQTNVASKLDKVIDSQTSLESKNEETGWWLFASAFIMFCLGGAAGAWSVAEVNRRIDIISCLLKIMPSCGKQPSNGSNNVDELLAVLRELVSELKEGLSRHQGERDKENTKPAVKKNPLPDCDNADVIMFWGWDFFKNNEKFVPLSIELGKWFRDGREGVGLIVSSLGQIAFWLQGRDKRKINDKALLQALYDLSSGLTLIADECNEDAMAGRSRLVRWQKFLMEYSDQGNLFALEVPSLNASINPTKMVLVNGIQEVADVSKIRSWAVIKNAYVQHRAEVE